MASKRMFDKSIIDTDRFADMPMSTKALYFLLGMEADDYGFVSPKRVTRMHGGTDDDVKLLIAKNFVIPFDTGVVVITDWYRHNWLDKRRIKPTEYRNELAMLSTDENERYCIADDKPVLSQYNTTTKQSLSKCNATAKQQLSQYSIEEYRGEESSIDICSELSANADPPSGNFSNQTPDRYSEVIETKPEQGVLNNTENAAITLILNDKSEYPVFQEQINQWVEIYPAVDVMQKLREMKDWCTSNPTKRKTKRGILKFITNWLIREQDKGRPIDSAQRQQPRCNSYDGDIWG